MYPIQQLSIIILQLLNHLPSIRVVLGKASLTLILPDEFVTHPDSQEISHVSRFHVEKLRLRRLRLCDLLWLLPRLLRLESSSAWKQGGLSKLLRGIAEWLWGTSENRILPYSLTGWEES